MPSASASNPVLPNSLEKNRKTIKNTAQRMIDIGYTQRRSHIEILERIQVIIEELPKPSTTQEPEQISELAGGIIASIQRTVSKPSADPIENLYLNMTTAIVNMPIPTSSHTTNKLTLERNKWRHERLTKELIRRQILPEKQKRTKRTKVRYHLVHLYNLILSLYRAITLSFNTKKNSLKKLCHLCLKTVARLQVLFCSFLFVLTRDVKADGARG